MSASFLGIVFVIIFSSIFIGNAYGSIFLDKGVYTWTDKINIRITEHGVDAKGASVKIYTDNHELNNYKLSKTGNGLYTGKIILTGFLHDVNGDGKPDTNPRTVGSGPNNGFLESDRDGDITITVRFADGDTISKSAQISWNKGNIVLDNSYYLPSEFAKIQVTDVDMNLNPETLDKIPLNVFSDSDKAGIIVDAIETQEASGVFETTFSFTQEHASSGDRLFAILDDTIYAQYNDYTLPEPFRVTDSFEIITESVLVDDLPIPEPEQDTPVPQSCGPDTILEDGICIIKEQFSQTNSTGIWGPVIEIPQSVTPLKQIKSGISIDEIKCKDNLQLILKTKDNSPACVTFETFSKLVERGWGEIAPISEPEPESTPEPEPDTGEFRYGEQECYFVDKQGESQSCVVSGWAKSASELDCKKICAPPGTKE